MDKTFLQMLDELIEAAFQHGMTSNNFMVLGCACDPKTSNDFVDLKKTELVDSLYNKIMVDNPSDDTNELIEEFLDYLTYFGADEGVGLSFDTRISKLEREEAKFILEQFIRYTRDENPSEKMMEDLMMGRDVEDDI